MRDKKFGENISFYYAFNPIIIVQVYADVNEFVTLFFTLLAIYFLIKKKKIFSSISLSLGIAFKIYPIFFVIPISIYIFRNSERNWIKRLVLFYCTIIVSLLLICLPFLIFSMDSFIKGFLIHVSRRNLGNSIVNQFIFLQELYNPAFEIFGIHFSYQFIIQICVMLIIFLFLAFSKRTFNTYDLFMALILICLILPLINYQFQLKYTYLMAFPFLLFLIGKNRLKSVEENKLNLFFISNLISILLFFFIFLIFFPPINNLLNYENLAQKAILISIITMLPFIIYIINEYKLKNQGDFKIHLINVIPVLIYISVSNIITALVVVFFVGFSIIYIIIKYWFNKSIH